MKVGKPLRLQYLLPKELSSTIHGLHFQARVYYDGLLNKCFSCGATGHVKSSCPNRNSINSRLQQLPEGSGEAAVDGDRNSGTPALYSQVLSAPSKNEVKLNLVKLNPKPSPAESVVVDDTPTEMETHHEESSSSSEVQVAVGEREAPEWEVVRGRGIKRSAVRKTASSNSSEGDADFDASNAPENVDQRKERGELRRQRSKSKQRRVSESDDTTYKVPEAADLLVMQRARSQAKYQNNEK